MATGKRGRPSNAEIAARKQAAEQRIAPPVLAKYEAAGRGRRTRGWNAPNSGPNKAKTGSETVRDRVRDAERNDWAGASSNQKWATTLIGIGITPRFSKFTNKDRKAQVTEDFKDFVAKCDADGVLNLYGLQTLAVKAWLRDGEVFSRRRSRRASDGLPVPMQIQIIESEFVPKFDADVWTGMSANNRIRSGIEFDNRGMRQAYWVYRAHPGDSMGTEQVSRDKLVRVPASEMIHMYEPDRPGSLRGVSTLAAILTRLRSVADYDDAVLERQKLANLFMAFIKWSLPNMAGDDVDPLTGLALDAGGSPLGGMSPGIVQELEPGQEVQFANPPEAGTMYGEYMRYQNMGTAAGQGLPYEVFSGDIVNVSDRTLRVIMNEFRRFAEQRQWQIIIPQFCQKIIDWYADAALLAGIITVDEVKLVRRCEHAPHGWAYIHPVQDVQGKQLEVEAGFRSRSSVIYEKGDDAEVVDDERAADKKREESLGLAIDPVQLAMQQQQGADPAQNDKQAAKQKKV